MAWLLLIAAPVMFGLAFGFDSVVFIVVAGANAAVLAWSWWTRRQIAASQQEER